MAIATSSLKKYAKVLPARPQICYRKQPRRLTRNHRKPSFKLLGLHHVFNTNCGKTYRFLWAVFIATNICVCSCQIYNRVAYFLGHPIRTDVNIEQQKKIQFPSFTFCPFSGQYPQLKDVQTRIARDREDVIYCKLRLSEIIEFSGLDLERDLEVIWKNSSIFSGIVEYSLRDYKSRNLNTSIALSWKEVKNGLGTCHTFTVPGVPIYNSVWRVLFRVDYNSSCDALVLIAMHPDEDVPNIYSDMNPHYFKRASAQMYSLTMQEFIRKSTPDRPCNKKRAVSKCRRDCYFKILRRGIKCRMPHLPYADLRPCKNKGEALRVLKYEQKIQSEFDIFVNCTHCRVKCEETMYVMNLLHSEKRPHDDILVVAYSYETNVLIVVTEEYAYVLVSLLCDIGGNLGLFLGLCLVSIAEICEKTLSNIVKACQKRQK